MKAPADFESNITAVCVPYAVSGSAGCFFRVINATPESTVRVRVRSSEGATVSALVTVEIRGFSLGVFIHLESRETLPPSVSGVAEYPGQPGSRVAVLVQDPDLRFTHIKCTDTGVFVFRTRALWTKYKGSFDENEPIDFYIHNAALDEDRVISKTSHDAEFVAQSWHIPWPDTGLDKISVTVYMPRLGMLATMRCPSCNGCPVDT